MKWVEVNGKRLGYCEVNADKIQTILFLNGNSHGRQSFNKQLKDSRFEDYRLIAIDLPGHGDSSYFQDYTLINISEMIHQFVLSQKIENYIVVGHSLGGHVALHLLGSALPQGIVIFGTPPLAKPFCTESFLPNENAAPLAQRTATIEELKKLSNELRYNQEYEEQFITDYFKADENFRAQIFNTIGTDEYLDEVVLLEKYTGNVLAFICQEDKIVNSEYINKVLAQNPKFMTKDLVAAHSPQLEVADEFNEGLLEFANRVLRTENFTILNELKNINQPVI